jgi:mycofactocin precursor
VESTNQENPSHSAAVAPERARDGAGKAAAIPVPADGGDELVLAELLVEDVSIDGMCGVY